MSKRSRQFRRVSTDQQDSSKQIRALEAWDVSHDYLPGTPYVQDDKSAYHGKHIPELERAIREMESGEYDVLTFWASDRMWRGKSLATILGYIERLEAVGYVEFVNDSHLNNRDLDPMVRNTLFAAAFGMSYGESKRKAERTKMDIADKQAKGNLHGRNPWGMVIQCRVCGGITHRAEDGSLVKCGHVDTKTLVYTSEGRTYLPLIFQAVIDGKSLREIAMWLDSEGVKTMSGKPWNEAVLGNRIIRNKTYAGQRPNSGNLEVEAIVTPTVWQQANASLNSRYRPGRGTTVTVKPVLKPVCSVCYGTKREGCPSGKSVMQRVYVGKENARKAYYRCTGHGPQRKGCGAPMVPCAELDGLVMAFMLTNTKPHVKMEFVAGDDTSDKIEGLRLRLDKATSRQESNELWDQIEALESQTDVKPHWQPTETDQTEGDYFASLDSDGQRKHLASFEILANYKSSGEGMAKVPGFIITGLADAEAYGLKPL